MGKTYKVHRTRRGHLVCVASGIQRERHPAINLDPNFALVAAAAEFIHGSSVRQERVMHAGEPIFVGANDAGSRVGIWTEAFCTTGTLISH